MRTLVNDFYNGMKRLSKEILVVFLVGLGVHFAMYSNWLTNPDGMWFYGEHFALDWEFSCGRFGWPILDMIRGGSGAPVLNTYIAMAFFAVGSVLLNEVLDIRNTVARYCASLSIISAPIIANLLSYYYMSLVFGLAFCLAIASVWFIKRYDSWKIVVPAAVVLMMSISLYQSSLGIAAALCMMVLVIRIINRPDDYQGHVRLALRMLLYGAIGVGLYYGILQVVLSIRNIEIASYGGIGGFSLELMLQNVGPSIKQAYLDFYEFFLGNRIMVNSYNVSIYYTIIAVAFVVSLLINFVNVRKLPAIVLTVLLIALLPIACNITVFIATDTAIILRTAQAMFLVVPFMLALVSKGENRNGTGIKDRAQTALRWGSCVVCACLVFGYSTIDNMDALLMKTNENKTIQLANRLCAFFEENDHYKNGGKVLIAGVPRNAYYDQVLEWEHKTNVYAGEELMWSDYNAAWNGWRQIFKYHLGVEPNWCLVVEGAEIIETDAFKEMNCYPKPGAVAVINDVLVIKISDF